MSTHTKYFDEETETQIVGPNDLTTRLRDLVDLESEIHVTNLQNNRSGSFRVIWVDTSPGEGSFAMGLELVDSEGPLWPVEMPPAKEDAAAPQAVLECQRCHGKLLTPVPEAEGEFVHPGFRLARHCDQCKATTPWAFVAQTMEAVAGDEEALEATPWQEQRVKGRAPIQMRIKVIRSVYGTPLEDICETANVSRGGALFITNQHYDVGEVVQVVLPYKEGDVSIPVPARVARIKPQSGSLSTGVAISLLEPQGGAKKK